MFEKLCKLRVASRYFFGGGGGGGSTNISGPYGLKGGNRNFGTEMPIINQGYGNQIDQYNQFTANNPLFNAANQGALNFYNQLPSLTDPLKALEGQTPGFFSGLQNQIQGIEGQVPGLQNNLQGIYGGLGGLLSQIPGLQQQSQQGYGGLLSQLPGLQNQIGGLFGQSQDQYNQEGKQFQGLQNQLQGVLNSVPGQFSGIEDRINALNRGLPNVDRLTNPLRSTFGDYGSAISNVYNPVVQSGGALTGQQLRDATQQSRALGPSGSLQDPGAIASEVLNRDTAKDNRLGLYSGLMQNAATTQGGLAGQIQGLIGSDTGLRSGLLGQLAGVRQGALGLQSNLLGQAGSLESQRGGLQQGALGLGNQLTAQQGNLLGLGGSLLGQNAGIQQGLLNTGGSLYGQQGQNVQQQSGLLGMLSALTGQSGNLFGQQVANTSGLSSGQQTLQGNSLNQLIGTGGAGVSAFGGLTNPILGYLGNLFGGNQQTQIAQAQINAQQNQANSAKQAGGISGIGSVISTVLPIALAAFSDERVKSKIADSGLATPEGVPISTWEYKTNPGVRFLGATAQDIEKKVPSAVFTDPRSGLKMIDTTQFPIVQISATKPTKKAA